MLPGSAALSFLLGPLSCLCLFSLIKSRTNRIQEFIHDDIGERQVILGIHELFQLVVSVVFADLVNRPRMEEIIFSREVPDGGIGGACLWVVVLKVKIDHHLFIEQQRLLMQMLSRLTQQLSGNSFMHYTKLHFPTRFDVRYSERAFTFASRLSVALFIMSNWIWVKKLMIGSIGV